MDAKLLLLINSFSGHSSILDRTGIIFAVYGIYVLIAWAIIVGYKKNKKNLIIAIFSSVISRFIIVQGLKVIINRPRPYEILPKIHLLLTDTGNGGAFSSGHAVIMFSIAFSFYKTKWFWPMIVLATLSSIARVFVGVHYPTDILASVIIAWIVVWVLRKLYSKKSLI